MASETPLQKNQKYPLDPNPLKKFLNPRIRTIHSVLFVLDCQVISEVKADTCITFTKPNSTEVMYIKRYADPLCVFINMEVFPNVNAWNRSFTCNRSSYELSVCFSDTKISDSGSFYLFVRNIQENSTSLDVECKCSKKIHIGILIQFKWVVLLQHTVFLLIFNKMN